MAKEVVCPAAVVQIAILKDCRNVHVVQFLGACMHPGCTMLITELMAANAQDLIHSGKLPWREKCASSQQASRPTFFSCLHPTIQHLPLMESCTESICTLKPKGCCG